MEKSLDTKLKKIRLGQYKPSDFIIADAKDADMGGGIFCPGVHLEDASRPRSFPEYLQAMREMVSSGLVDLMLMSASGAERLVEEGYLLQFDTTTLQISGDFVIRYISNINLEIFELFT